MKLCITRVDISYTKEYIFSIMCRLKWGKICKITETRPNNNTGYRCVMIDIVWNDTTTENDDFKSRILNGNYINIVHDASSHTFWRIMESNRR